VCPSSLGSRPHRLFPLVLRLSGDPEIPAVVTLADTKVVVTVDPAYLDAGPDEPKDVRKRRVNIRSRFWRA